MSGAAEPDTGVSRGAGQRQLLAEQQRGAESSEADKVDPENQPGFRAAGQRPAYVAGASAGA